MICKKLYLIEFKSKLFKEEFLMLFTYIKD